MPTDPGGPDASSVDHGHRWTCPICATSRMVRRGEHATDPETALRTHVFVAHGDGHGRAWSFPDDLEASALADHVERDAE